MKHRQIIAVAMILFIISISFPFLSFADNARIVGPDKIWTIQLNKDIDPSTLSSDSVYVKSDENKLILTVFHLNELNEIKVRPIIPYEPGDYTLHVTNGLKDESGKNLSQNYEAKFKVVDGVKEAEEKLDYEGYIVKYRDGAIRIMSSVDDSNALRSLNAEVIPGDYKNFDALKEELQAGNIDYIEPNYILESFSPVSNDPFAERLWGLKNYGQTIGYNKGTEGVDINVEHVWGLAKGAGAVIAVIDNGVDRNHSDLLGSTVQGYCFVTNSTVPSGDGHGTHVAGTIAANKNNDIGIVGVAPEAKIMSLKFLSSSGSGTTANAIRAIEYASDKGIKISNNSWGGGSYSKSLEDAIKNSGMLFIAAAGNSSRNSDVYPMYPAAYKLPNIISVASVTNKGNLSYFSNYGKTTVHVGAPGSAIYSTTPNNNYAYYDGTSMAAPHVAGVAALLYSSGVTDIYEIKERILKSARQNPLSPLQNTTITGGMVDAAKAFSGVILDPPEPEPTPEPVIKHLFKISLKGVGATNPLPGTYAVADNTKFTITAVENDSKYYFSHWERNGNKVSSDKEISYVVKNDMNLQAVFEEKPPVIIRFEVTAEEGGDTNFKPSSQLLESGSTVFLLAYPYALYDFDYWQFKNHRVYENRITIEVNANNTPVRAFFKSQESVLNVSVNNSTYGSTVPAPGTHFFEKGSIKYIEAFPNNGYEVSHWIINGSEHKPVGNRHQIDTVKASNDIAIHFKAIEVPVEPDPVPPIEDPEKPVPPIEDPEDTTPEKYFEFDELTGTITDYHSQGGPNVHIPSKINGITVKHIGAKSFREKNIVSVMLPDSIETIGYYAFVFNSIARIDLPSSLEYIGHAAFCENKLSEITIPSKVKEIHPDAFSFNKLTKVEFLGNVEYLGASSFNDNLLTSFNIPKGIDKIEDGVLRRNRLTQIVIPANIKSIGNNSFAHNNLSKVDIPNSVTSIGRRAFILNSELKSIRIPTSVRTIGEQVFEYSYSDPADLTIISGSMLIKEYAEKNRHTFVLE